MSDIYGKEWLNSFMTLLTYNQISYTTEVLKIKTINTVKHIYNTKIDHNPRRLPIRYLMYIFLDISLGTY